MTVVGWMCLSSISPGPNGALRYLIRNHLGNCSEHTKTIHNKSNTENRTTSERRESHLITFACHFDSPVSINRIIAYKTENNVGNEMKPSLVHFQKPISNNPIEIRDIEANGNDIRLKPKQAVICIKYVAILHITLYCTL